MNHSAARLTRPPKPEPAFYGWRYVHKRRPDGTLDLVQVPLSLEDVLHPQEGDVIPEHTLQERDAEYLRPIIRQRAERLDGGLFLADCLVDWGVPGIRNHSPDLTVFDNVLEPPAANFGLFHLRDSRARCVLVIEIVSPHTRNNDVVEKLREYHQVGVPIYVLIDQQAENGPRSVLGYRRTAQRYVPMRLDKKKRLLVKPLGLWLAVEDQHAICYDAETGERLGDYQAEAEARRTAEEQVRTEAEARRAAEEQARTETEARRAAEERVRQLEEELRRARGKPHRR